MDAPSDPALLHGVVGPRLLCGDLRRLVDRGLAAAAEPVDDGVPGDRVEPRGRLARDGSNLDAERQMLAKVSWVASSARPRSPIRRRAIPSTERA